MYFLALKQLFSRKRQNLLILLGISLGTAMYILISGLQLGSRDYFVKQLLSNTPHVKVSASDETIEVTDINRRFFKNQLVHWQVPPGGKREEARVAYPQGWFSRFRVDSEVDAYSPSLSVNVIASLRNIKKSAMLTGVIPETYKKITDYESRVVEGRFNDIANGGNKLIAGTVFLDQLGARVGDSIFLTSGKGELRPFRIVGKLSFGNRMLDGSVLIAYLGDVQQLNKTPGRVSEIGVRLFDLSQAKLKAEEWSTGSKDNVESWDEINSSIFEMFRIQDITRYIITGTILVVAGFGIYNVLSIMINQKKREIAILRSIGYMPSKILQLFLIQGMILGVLGATVGLGLGYASNNFIGSIKVNMPMGMGTRIIVSHAVSIYVIGFLAACASSLLASILPAIQASRLTPLDIIRSE